METAALTAIANVIVAMGPGGVLAVVLIPGVGVAVVVLVLWYLNSRSTGKLMADYRNDTMAILKQYGEAQTELRQMYENNVELVKDTFKLADAFQTTVVRNTEAITQLNASVESNQYCPLNRIEKRAEGPRT